MSVDLFDGEHMVLNEEANVHDSTDEEGVSDDDGIVSDDEANFNRLPRRTVSLSESMIDGDESFEESTDLQPPPPALQRCTSFERTIADAIVHQAPLEELKIMLSSGGQIKNTVGQGLTPLHYAVWQRYPEAAELLIDAGCDVNAVDDIGFSPLHLASRYGYIDIMEVLINHGAQINFNNPDPEDQFPIDAVDEPLRLALKHGHPDAVRLLLHKGADPNGRYFFGSEINLVNPLHTELLELLLSYGAQPDTRDRYSLTPAMKACRLQQGMESLLLLISYGSQIDLRANARHDHRTALHYAVLSGSIPIVTLLLKQGAQVEFEEEYDNPTPLHLAVRKGDIKMINILLDAGADINASTSVIGSPLHMACSERVPNRLAVLQELLERGADPNIIVKGMNGSPILPPLGEYLAWSEELDADVINLLLKYGAAVVMQSPQHSPLGLLNCFSALTHDTTLLLTILEAAQRFDIPLIRHSSLIDDKQRDIFLKIGDSPLPLKHLTRVYLQELLCPGLPSSIYHLELPKLLNKYLLYEIS